MVFVYKEGITVEIDERFLNDYKALGYEEVTPKQEKANKKGKKGD